MVCPASPAACTHEVLCEGAGHPEPSLHDKPAGPALDMIVAHSVFVLTISERDGLYRLTTTAPHGWARNPVREGYPRGPERACCLRTLPFFHTTSRRVRLGARPSRRRVRLGPRRGRCPTAQD